VGSLRRAVPLVVALLAGTITTNARATDATVSAFANQFLPPSATISQGGRLTFANTDVAPHNVIADATGKNGPIFGSATVTAGGQADVKGVDKLKPATYTFHCSVHPQMHGSLTVTAPGSPTAIVATPTGASVATPTSATFFNGALYVTSWGAGTVMKLALLPGGALAAGTPYATGFSSPLGLAFAPDGTLYVADSWTPPNAARAQGRVWAVKPDGSKTAVIDGLPNGRHNTNGLTVRNNRLYVANGNATDDGVTGGPQELPLNGTVLSYALPVTAKSKPTVEAKGLRNVYDVAFRPGTNEVWFPTNGPDALDPYGEDLLHKVDVTKATADYDFPACVYKAGLVRGQNPAIARKCRPTANPELALGLHVSADGLAFGTGGVWGNDVYIAEYGSNDPSAQGHRVVRVPIVNGRAGAPQDVVIGPSPLDVAFGPDGLYVVDFDSGAILLLRAVA
jgi:glucose/arabinose dehydrogenase/plastocyanin